MTPDIKRPSFGMAFLLAAQDGTVREDGMDASLHGERGVHPIFLGNPLFMTPAQQPVKLLLSQCALP